MAIYLTQWTGVFQADGTYIGSSNNAGVNIWDGDPLTDNVFEFGEPVETAWTYVGQVTAAGQSYPVIYLASADEYTILTGTPWATQAEADLFFSQFTTQIPPTNTADFTVCFAAGSRIATPRGEAVVEALKIGDRVLTADGKAVPVKWIGRQTVHTLFAGPRTQPVRIRAGALGDGLPHADLTVTGDHGMIVDGLVINAAALVNGTTIDWVPTAELPEQVVYYHIETEAHDVILANGAPSETFIDYAGRTAFDNYAEYVALYGAERIIPEMSTPRISSQRLLPDAIRARLGISNDGIECDKPLSEQALSA